MKAKIIVILLIMSFVFSSFVGLSSATLDKRRTEDASTSSIPKSFFIETIRRTYVIGNATEGKQNGRIALIKFSSVTFESISFFPLRVDYSFFNNVTVLLIGLRSKIPDGPFHLDTKANIDKVNAIIFRIF